MPRILISGAGVAGAVLAYWLGKNGFTVVVIERSLPSWNAGQIIDVEGSPKEIVKRMGVLEEIQSKMTHEAGIRFVDELSHEFARFPALESGASKEIEIMRLTLVEVLLNAADNFSEVEFRHGCTIQSLQQSDSKVTVEIRERENGGISKEDFDILVACDGLRSTTRDMILPVSERESCLKSANFFGAYFCIPAQPRDRPFCNVHFAAGRRTAMTKPWTDKETSAYLLCGKADQKLRDARASRDVKLQKETLAALFKGLG